MPERSDYNFLGALRIFSLAVALISCGLGIRLGWNDAQPQYLLALLLVLGGLFAQAGINLVNDIEDLRHVGSSPIGESQRRKIRFNHRIGWIAFSFAILIGLYLVSLRGWPLLAIISVSSMLALNYNAGPLNFKHNGSAIVQVFLLMGVLMIQATYFVMTGNFSWRVLWVSLPVSLLVSLLLLSNEIRDYEYDRAHKIRTCSVRIGLRAARLLYQALIALAFFLTILYCYSDYLKSSHLLAIIPSLLMLPVLKKHLYAEDRSLLTPLSGRFFLLFGVAYIMMA